MSESVLPGVLIEVRPEGLIVPGRVTVGNLGVVGTAAKGPIGKPVVLGSYAEAVSTFGMYDSWKDGASDELSLVRALELIFGQGARTAFAVRVAAPSAAKAAFTLEKGGSPVAVLRARTAGTWGNALSVEVVPGESNAVVSAETATMANTLDGTLAHKPVVQSARNSIRIVPGGGGLPQQLGIIYSGAPAPGQVLVEPTSGAITLGAPLGTGDTVVATYMVEKASAVTVIVRLGAAEERFNVVSGTDLIADLTAPVGGSAWVEAAPGASVGDLPAAVPQSALTGGSNGAAGADLKAGLDTLLDVDAHIIVAAGRALDVADDLASHCRAASSDAVKRERIAVVGAALGAAMDALPMHDLNSDRVIFVGPGIRANDNSASPPAEVTLPGAYTAAAVAGLIAASDPHVSPTNKVLDVAGLEKEFTRAELEQLVLARMTVLERRQGFRIVKGITTSTNSAWHQITTRRIVDYAKFGVRSAANPYIGLLNNERVRGALRATINSFLADMVEDEMLISYQIDVSATRDDERKGVAKVELVLRPTFSIDFIKVTMFLE